MQIHLNVIGALLTALALVHVIFPRYFNWKAELQALSLVNKQMMEVHTFFVALMVLLMGLLCLTSSEEIVSTPLGQRIALGLGLFWLIRLFFQFFVYSPKLWKGKVFETSVHILFIGLWTYLSFIFLWIGFQ
ncbi:MAG: hypothetical protein AAF847_11580 [Bacteroidota bacterium]